MAAGGIDTTDSEGAGGEAGADVGVGDRPEAGGGELGEGAEASPLTSPGRFAAAAWSS